MDIEGYERFALEGLANTLRLNRPTVLIEISSTKGNPNAIKNWRELRALFPGNYEFAGLNQGENLPLGYYELFDISGYHFDASHSVYIVAFPAELESRIP